MAIGESSQSAFSWWSAAVIEPRNHFIRGWELKCTEADFKFAVCFLQFAVVHSYWWQSMAPTYFAVAFKLWALTATLTLAMNIMHKSLTLPAAKAVKSSTKTKRKTSTQYKQRINNE